MHSSAQYCFSDALFTSTLYLFDYAGDKILSLTISFRHIVYEDALTILSYASPYDVTLELEKGTITTSSNTLKQRKASSAVSLSGSSPAVVAVSGLNLVADSSVYERLVHPLYRSQSIDDLSKVISKPIRISKGPLM